MTVGSLPDNFPSLESLESCLSCDYFRQVVSRSQGRRYADRIAQTSLGFLLDQINFYGDQLTHTTRDLNKKIEELSILKKVSDALLKTNDLDKTLKILLTGVTAGQAFGFNRAFIFLANEKKKILQGKMALGPQNPKQANQIWSELSQKNISFDQLIDEILNKKSAKDSDLTLEIKKIVLPLNSHSNVLSRSLLEKKALKIEEPHPDQIQNERLFAILGEIAFAAVPILSEDRAIGVLVADNCITQEPISDEDLTSLETFANQAATEIQNILLHQELKIKYGELESIHQLLKENQSYLLQHERLADIGKLATTAAHEIKTPLVAIGGYARRALKNFGSEKANLRDLEIIAEEVERLETITSEILDYSQKSKLNLEEDDLNRIVSESLEIFNEKLSYNGIELESQLFPRALKIKADSRRLRQVLLNLVGNAIEAMFQGGTLRIKTVQEEDYITLEVEDTGYGIPQDCMDKLFTPFFTTKPHGSGLGLSVSKKIITDHNGFIEVESKVNQGTKFTVSLPINH